MSGTTISMRNADTETPLTGAAHSSPWTLFCIFLRLGLTSFGGPAAHLGYFRDEFVTRQWKAWMGEDFFAGMKSRKVIEIDAGHELRLAQGAHLVTSRANSGTRASAGKIARMLAHAARLAQSLSFLKS